MTHDAPAPDVHHDPDARRLHTRVEGHEAELRYSLRDGRMVIDHTGVPDAIGGRGIISVVGNIVPQDMIALCKAFDAGNLAEALRLHKKLFPLCRDMLGLSTNPIPVKTAMRMLGRDTGELRLPMTPLSGAEEAKLRTTLIKYGLVG